jgi:hypothetical protein
MGEEANEERAQQIYEKSTKIEQQFGDVLTSKDSWWGRVACSVSFLSSGIVEEESLSDAYDQICEIIDREQAVDMVWVPTKEKL